jgi:4-hydroxy-tetrahydrodipicolinate reductase
MGRLIAGNVIESDDMDLVSLIDPAGGTIFNLDVYQPENLVEILKKSEANVLVDFTNADSSCRNAVMAAEIGLRLVIGTTGMTKEQLDSIRAAVNGKVAAVVAPNFATGINVLIALTRKISNMLPDFDVEIIEVHHNAKLDAPSGTALALHDALSEGRGRQLPAIQGRNGESPRGDEVGIHSIRGGDIVGEHTVLFAGQGERLEVTHRASSRQAFAEGTIRAIRWLRDREPGMYDMSDVLDL